MRYYDLTALFHKGKRQAVRNVYRRFYLPEDCIDYLNETTGKQYPHESWIRYTLDHGWPRARTELESPMSKSFWWSRQIRFFHYVSFGVAKIDERAVPLKVFVRRDDLVDAYFVERPDDALMESTQYWEQRLLNEVRVETKTAEPPQPRALRGLSGLFLSRIMKSPDEPKSDGKPERVTPDFNKLIAERYPPPLPLPPKLE